MAVSNPFGVLRQALQRTVREQLEVRREVAKTVKALIKGQFALGVDPDGRKQPVRADGKDAFLSSRLQNAVKVTPTQDGVEGVGELKEGKSGRARRQWLRAHQDGYTFPARQSGGYRIARNAKGKRTTIAALKRSTVASERSTTKTSWLGLRSKTTVRRTAASKRVDIGQREDFWRESKSRASFKGSITNVLAHHVGERVLPIRRIYPEGALGRRWGGWIKAAVSSTLSRQLARNVKDGG